MFWERSKKNLNSEEYEKLLKKVAALDALVLTLQAKYEAVNTNYNDLRGKFNRKLNILKQQQDEDEEAQDLNKPFTPFLH